MQLSLEKQLAKARKDIDDLEKTLIILSTKLKKAPRKISKSTHWKWRWTEANSWWRIRHYLRFLQKWTKYQIQKWADENENFEYSIGWETFIVRTYSCTMKSLSYPFDSQENDGNHPKALNFWGRLLLSKLKSQNSMTDTHLALTKSDSGFWKIEEDEKKWTQVPEPSLNYYD